MANILGRYLLKCSDKYKEEKDRYKSFEDFFEDYLDKNVLNKESLFTIINDFFSKEFWNIKENSTDEDIESILNSLSKNLLENKIIRENSNVKELIGYILLGNLLNN